MEDRLLCKGFSWKENPGKEQPKISRRPWVQVPSSPSMFTVKVVKDLLTTLLCIGFLVIFIHELGHIIAQLVFGVPIVISFSLKGISTNNGQLLQYTDTFGTLAIIISGPLAPLILFPYIKKLIQNVKIPKSTIIFNVIFILMLIGASTHDIGLILRFVFS